jgi:ParB-like chromosome segregation protein Spo0J
MLIEDWPLSKIRPYPNNPRVLRNAAEKVAESIKSFGWRQPIVVDSDGVIVAGHSRHAAAQLLKLKTVPVHVAKDLSPDQVRALRIADNKTATFADWDDAKLADELSAIMEGLGDITSTGFSQSEFDALEMSALAELSKLEQVNNPAPAQADEEPDEEPAPASDEPAPSQDEPPPLADMVPFNVLMTFEARQVVYDAVAAAKKQHGLEQTADAMLVIARKYLDA